LWHLHLGKFQGNKIHSDERREANLPVNVVISRESCQNSSPLRADLGPVNTFGVQDQGQSQKQDQQLVIQELFNAQSYFYGHVYRAHLLCAHPHTHPDIYCS
jgi:hypothetical protein